MSTLINEDLVPRLAKAVDRVAVEIQKKPPKAIIPDHKAMAAKLARLFTVRHILVHEHPEHPAYDLNEVGGMLQAAGQFALAANETFTEILYGKVPLTTHDMRIAIGEELDRLNTELASVMEQLAAKLDRKGQQMLRSTQLKWTTYRDKQADFRAYFAGKGTIGPQLRLDEARDLTEDRLRKLKWYLEREEGDM